MTITVTEAGNQLPILATIGAQSTTENIQLTFGVSSSDIESTPTLITSALPTGANFTDNTDGTGSFDWTPTFVQSGSYPITFYATDDSSSVDSELVTITVIEAGNQNPVVSDIPDQTVAEGSSFTTINLDNYVADPDNLDSEIGWTYSGNAALTVSIDVNRIATIAIPDADWNGTEAITFTATDPGVLSDSDPATFTVTAVNDAPVAGDIPAQTIAEGLTFATIDLDTYVSDIDNLASEINWTYSGNVALTVSIDINRVATVTIPNIDWNGAETITFIATDPGLLSDSDPAVFTVTAVNDAPIVGDIPDETIAEGSTFATINLDSYVTDVDNLPSEMTWTYSGNTALTVSIVNRVVSISTPDPDWNGSETITFTATDPGLLADSDPAVFTVTAVNDAPVVSDIVDQTIDEGSSFATINLDDFVDDVDNLDSEINWTYSGNSQLTVSIDINRVATISTPDAEWSGIETITFTATDPGLLANADDAIFTVNAVNDAPVVADIPNQTIVEGLTFATINLDTYVTDIDNLASEMSWTFTGNVDLNVSIDINRVATITTPNADWNGSEIIAFTATDPGLLFASDPATFTVTGVNDAPVVSDIPDQTVPEGSTFATVNLDSFVSDIDNLDSEIGWTYTGNTALTVSIDGSRIATITIPDAEWNGSETITFTATDPGVLSDSDPASFTVTAVNDAPVVSNIPDQTIPEGNSFTAINLDSYVSDVDNLISELTWSYSGNSQLNVSIVNNVAIVSTPGANWNGSETITFTATDPGLLSGSDPAIFTVTGVNDAPVVSNIPNQTIAEGNSFAVIALDDYVSDIDNIDSEMIWTYTGNSQLTVSIDVNRVATITVPSAQYNGSETITFTATDPGLLNSSDPATFTVTATNDAPIVSDIPDQSVAEGAAFTTIDLDTYVADPDNIDSEISWTYSGNTDLIVSIDVNRVATVTTPSADWHGSELITFTATDPSLLSNSDPATFTVTPVNDAPVVSDIPNQTVAEGLTFATVNLDGYVTDVDNLASEMTWSYSGNTDLTVSIDANRIATITIPSLNWFGAEVITFTANDPGLLSDSDPATFTVTNVNDGPVVADIPNQTVSEGAPFATINLDNFVADIDNLDSEISWTYSGNTDLTVSIDGSRVATITPPTADWNGSESITFTATDPGLLLDSDPAVFTVTAVNDAPVVLDIPDQTVPEGSTFTTINLDNYVTDVDNLAADMTWSYSGNTELTVSIVNRLAIIGIPSANWNGSETITFTATDPGLLNSSDDAIFTVTAINNTPVVTNIPNQTVAEGATFTTINLDTYVSDVDNLDAEMTWSYVGNTQLTVSIDINRVATVSIPNADWNGSETITFTATDPGLLSDSDPATFTVTAINDGPVVADIPDQTIDEGSAFVTINLDSYVSDVDNADAAISWSYTGTTALLVSIDGSRIATISTPSSEWSGSETITFTATDPGLLFDSDPATFTVNAINDAPLVTDIPDQTIAEGATFATINLDNFVTDLDNLASEMSWSYSGNSALTVSIDINRVATITTPSADWNGSEAITFTATDPGLLSDFDPATFTVTGINDAPVVSDIPGQTIAEGAAFATIALDNYVSDVDNLDSDINWTFGGNTDLIVSIGVNRIATITTPSPTWNGSETITFTATDPGLLADSDPATFTVSAVNNAPVVSDIPGQTISEGGTFTSIDLDNYVTDVDNLDSEITWSFSGNVDLLVIIDINNIATISTPDINWNGSENITFTATDPSLLSNSDQATFTVTATNDAPVVADIPNQTVLEGSNFTTINLDDYVSDVDNLDSEMNWTFAGNTLLSVSIVNRVAIVSTPGPDWNGSETITFTATDPGALSSFDPATFTVTAVNDAPIVTDIPDQTIAEGATFATINLDSYVSDADNLDSEMNWSFVGNSQLSVTINVNRVATITTPSLDWNGSETITFRATDPGLAFDADPASFTVTAVNDAPVVSDIPDQTVPEGSTFATIALDNFVADVDNIDSDISWTFSGNTALSVVIDAGRVATISIPSPEWNGAETITFTATDPGLLTDNDAATFTVTSVNNPPIVSNIPNQTIAEGATFATINLDNFVSDIDNLDSEISWSYAGNTALSVAIDINRIATVTIPSVDWDGSEIITFTATDPGLLSDSDPATFTVTAVNDAPIMADIPNQTIAEGGTFAQVNLNNYVTDVDNFDNELSWGYAGNTDLTVVIDINRIATITTPDANWNGSETITFTVTDPGLLTDNDAATFTVSAVNNAPIVTDIPNQTISEGGTFTTITLDNYVSDVDNLDSEINWTYSGNTDLIVSIDVNRVATISTPDIDWSGSEQITFTATDPSLLSNSDQATFTVSPINDQPIVTNIPNQTIAEGASFTAINLDDFVSDVDNQDSEMSWSYAGNVQLTVSITNRVAIVSTPNSDWSGIESITFTATDPGSLSAFDAATFTVTAVNDAPVVANIPDQAIAEGATFTTINLDSYVSDVDNLDSEMGWSFIGNTQLTISLDVNRVATITIPSPDWNGSETITFTATDPGLLLDSDPATFTVTGVNDAPVVADIPDQSIAEGSSFATISLDSYVIDIDNLDSDINWTYGGNTALTVAIDVNRIATISIPSPDWNGAETITFTATDPGLLTDEDAATFTVTAVNNAPVVSNIPDQTISEGSSFATVTLDNFVADIDNLDNEMSWTYSGNTALAVSISASRIATITVPDADWNGSETITFTATDPGLLTDSDPASFTVTAVNDAPVLTDIPDQTIAEGATFATIALDDFVTDIDNLDSEISWAWSGSTNLTVSIDGSRVATITTPSPTWNGSETITFTATDPGLLDASDLAVFTVTAVNNAPVVSDIPDQTIAEGATFATIILDNFVTDVDNLASEMTWSYSGNSQLSVSIDLSRVATITMPDADWNGNETITFTATDPGLLSDSDPATFTVTGVNDAPVVSDIPNQTIAEGASFTTITLDNYVADIDNLDSEINWTFSGNTELTVVIDINRIATITTPSPTWNGNETITFTATDPGLLADSDPATFTVSAVNNSPVVSDIPDQTIAEGGTFTTISLDNFVTDVDNLDSEITWTYSGNTALIVSIDVNRIATITTPDVNWNGSELITFTATDPSLLSNSDPATFTVTPINDAPVVTDIPSQTIAEGANFTTINLDDFVSDLDNLDSDMSWTYAGNTQLSVSIVNRVAIVTPPDADWNGSETITFTASDPGGLSSFDPATFTITAVNDAPAVTNIPDQTIVEGATFTTINLDSYVSDVDNLDSEMNWSFVGNSQLSVTINVNRVATITAPSSDWNGSETITFTATDPGLLSDSDPGVFTITAVNDAPVVSDIPDQTIAEGNTFATINLDNYVADVDDADAVISWTFAGNTALTVNIDAGRIATITTPSPDWNGSETITFTATDPGLLADSDPAVFTVTSVNNAPVVTNIPNQTVAEGGTFTTIALDDYVSDIDNLDSEMNWTYSGNSQLIVSIDINRIATITIPSSDWNGSEIITFIATDPGLAFDSDPATFTVTAVNDAPIVSDIPDQNIAEGASFATINLDNYVNDVDDLDNQISWAYSGNTQLTVVIDINRVATITTPSPTWNGSEIITFTATDPGLLTDADPATFTVSAVNNAPIVTDIPNQSISEGGTFTTIDLDTYVSDVDNLDDEITWTYSGNTALIVSIDVNRIATITAPDANWFGSELITFTATDPSLLSNSDQATFTVTPINDQPVMTDIPNQTIAEGASFATINLDDFVSDIDNLDAEMSWSYAGNVQLLVSITNRVAIVSTPNSDWSGIESITFTATDPGGLSAFDVATFTVTAVNDAPVVADIPDQTIAEGATFATINLDSYVSDVDNLDSEMGWSFVGNTQLTISLDVNRVATITIPSPDWNGNETITFTATDPGTLSDSDPATFTVTGVNDAPVVSDIPDQTIAEGASFATISLDDYVSDIDNLDSDISWTYGGNTALTVAIDVNRIATITIPSPDWNGAETITFTATDPGLLFDSDAATFTVSAVNNAPVVSDIPDQTISEGSAFATITLDNYVTDIDNLDSEIGWSFSGNTALSVSISASRIATITVPDADWNGNEIITFTATDPGLLADSDPASFTVTAVNDAPTLTDIPDQTIAEGATFATIALDNFVTDIDNLDSEISWGWSGNTNLTVSIDGSRVATITTPSPTWNGNETITFTATDPGLLNASDQATFTVTAVNNAPVVSDIPDQTIAEGATFATIILDNFVTDVDNLASEMTWSYSGNSSLTVSIDVNRIATITTPSADWNGSEAITFTATDPGLLSDSDPATFTVTGVNDAPVVSDIPNQTIAEGASFTTITLDNYVADIDNLDSEINWTFSGNTELTVVIDINRIATITTPSPTWNGNETITFTATDPGLLADSDPATFTVSAVNNSPVVSDIPDQTIAEGGTFTTISLDNFVTDVDNLDSEITWTYSGNTSLIVSIDVNRIATITTPDVNWNGSELITFTATDPSLLSNSDPATFTVTPINDAPVVTDIPSQTIAEGANFTTINLDDFVSDVDNLGSEMGWTYAGNTQLSVSIVNRVAIVTPPDADWNGSETITFTASDPGGLSSFDPATFTITAVNDAPAVTNIPDQTIVEGATFTTINLDSYVSDVDNLDSEMNWSFVGNSQLSVTINVNRVATITAPSSDWNGSETITFTATDPGLLSDSDPGVFTITAVNDAPVVSDIPNQTIAEGNTFATINLDNYVADVDDADAVISWTFAGNTALTVNIDAGRIATITTPSPDWNGSETITFTATDPGLLFDSDVATFTVNSVNNAPVVTDIPNQTVAEGGTFTTITLDNFVSDIDNLDSEMNWTYSGNSQLTVSIDINRIATITIPDIDWNGSEIITFTATDPGLAFDSDPATFTVTAVNDAPIVSDIPDQNIAEGASFATINLDNYVNDVDDLDNQISWAYSGNTQLTVVIDINRVATITTPSPTWNGSEIITFTATDPGLLTDADPATFTVSAVNNAPIVTDIPNQSISEGGTFTTIDLDTYVSDVDNLDDEITWTYSGNTALIVSIDVNRIATITAPDANWFGSELITFTATDPSLLSNSDQATFTVTPINDQPVMTDIPNQTIAEGASFATINLDDFVSDIDNLDAEMSWSYAGNVQLSVSITNRVAIVSTPSADWIGVESITFTATDPGGLSAFDAATFTVTAVNDAPVVTDIPDQAIAEGATFTTINLDSYVSDVDNLDSEMSWSFVGNTQLTISLDVNRVATITIPSPDWNGNETITFTATDPGTLSDSDPATFTVTGVNDAPVVSDIPDQTIAEGASFATISLDDYVSDIDNLDSDISWTYGGNTALTVAIDVNRIATITIPSPDWNGAETITFTATDPGLLFDSDAATFTVSAVNNAPVVSDIPDQTISEGSSFATITLDNFVTDIDNLDNEISWTYSGNTALTVSISASRIATITVPDADWNGNEIITFTATDPGLLADSDPASFTVTAVNDAPTLTDIPDQTIGEGAAFATIALDDFVTDIDNLDSEISWGWSGNTNLTVSIDGSRVATITTPSPTWNGNETITFTATDPGLLNASDQATFTVTAVNNAPVVSDIPDQTIAEGATFATIILDNFVTDVDNLASEMTWSYSGNSSLTVSIDVNRIATITTPSADWNGSEAITFTATDPGLLSDSDPATFTVTGVNDAPVVSDIPNQTIAEGASFTTITLDNYVADIDNLDSEINWTFSGNTELTVVIDINRIATITTPSPTWNGNETITFTATDPGLLADSDPATFTVSAVNNSPVVSDIPDQTIAEGGTFTTISLDNFVTDVDNLDSEITWTYSGNTSLIVSIDVNRIATITTPDVNWNGSELITFTATDPSLLSNSDPATFTVTPINDAPVVTDIPSQTIAEGANFTTINLDDFVSDLDNLDSDMSWTYAGNTQLSVSIVNRVAIVSPPDADWNGSETITFTASDPGGLSSFDPATFTITAVNDAPAVTNIPDQTIVEGATFTTINLDSYVSDVDNLDSEMNWSFVGNSQLTISIDVNRIATITAPSADWNGSETITFTATDPGLLSDSDPGVFTITAVNDAPVVSDIPNQTIAEGNTFATINLDNYVADVDDADAVISWTFAGNTALTVNIDAGRIATITTPSPDWNGSETITFTATDPGLLFDSDVATFTVNSVNNAPVVTDIPNQTVAEGGTFTTITLDNFVSDIDNLDSEMNWTYSGNSQLTVSIDINRIATITIPDIDWNGSEIITFTATDPGLAFDSDPATFTVTAVNDAPIVSDIPDQTIAEGASFATVNLDNFVADVDDLDNQISWAYSGNTQLTVVIDINRVATITTPSPTWNGSEIITFTATDPGLLTDADPATFTVSAVNNAPIVTDIPDQTISEGGTFTTINLDNFVSDVDNIDSEISWTYSGNTALIVSIDVNRIATITAPDANWFGSELITFTATDPSLLSNSDQATFTVTPINDQPVVTDIPNQTIAEGASFAAINLDDFVSDIDNLDAEMSWSYAGNVQLSVSITNRVAIVTTPSPTWNGSEAITFTATDPGGLDSFDPATFTVTAVNNGPVVSDIPDQTIAEGATFTTIDLDAFVSDVDNLDSEMSWGFVGNSQLSVTVDVNRVATISIPNPDWNGSETITFTATDPSLLFDSDPGTFTVTAVNDAPVVSDIPDQTIAEGASFATISLDDYVSDIDNLDSDISWTYGGNTALTVAIDVNRIATITIPSPDWNGAETITFTATDPGLLFDSDPATFTVSAVNDPPVLATIGAQVGSENAQLVFGISASDAETIPTLSTSALPTGAGFTDNGDGTGSFDWTPDFTQAGAYNITFYATDDSSAVDSEIVAVTIGDAGNQPPVLTAIGAKSTAENVQLTFGVSANDAESTPTLTTSTLPTGATFVDNTDGTGSFDWTPSFVQSGTHNITFYATDSDAAVDSEVVVITVNEVGNQLPILAAIGSQTTTENVNLNIGVSATDQESTPTLTTSTLPIGATFTDNTDGTGVFDWTPSYIQNGTYNVTFYATDSDAAIDSEQVVITVNEAGNQAPILAAIGDTSTIEGIELAFTVNASDPDTTTPSLSTSLLPTGASFADNGDGTGTFIWTPSFVQTGSYVILFLASDGTLADSEFVTITVNEAGNQPPVLAAIGPQTIAESNLLTVNVSATDPEGPVTLTTSTLPTGAAFVDNTNGTGALTWTPTFIQAGGYSVTFYATDPGSLVDSEVVAITVTATNRAPFADAGPDQFTIPQGTLVTLDGTASSDPDGDSLGYSWLQIGGAAVTLSSATSPSPTFTPAIVGLHTFELTVDDAVLSSAPDTVVIEVINASAPVAVTDLGASIVSDAVQLAWSPSLLDTDGFPTTVDRYVVYRGTQAYFTPTPTDSVGSTTSGVTTFTDANIGGADVVGDTLTQYFYVIQVVDIYGNRSLISNRVGEYDYQIVVTTSTDFNLIGVPFTNTGISNAVDLIAAIGSSNVNTVNNFVAASQSYESRFAVGFGVNFTVVAGGIYQVNARTASVFSVAGRVPDSGTVSYSIVTTSTTDFNFLMIPFEMENNYTLAQDLLDDLSGVLNTLNEYVAGSQSYQSRFAAGFGTNFPVKAGKPYQGNAATTASYPGP